MHAEKRKIAKRMKYSTLTTEELQESYSSSAAELDFALVEAGLTRHEVDWLYGINLSRALTQAAKNTVDNTPHSAQAECKDQP